MGVYDRQKASAKRMIDKYGGLCTWNSVPASSPQPNEPWNPSPSVPTVYQNIRIAVFPSNSSLEKTMRKMLGSEVPVGDEVAYMAPVPFKVSLKDTFLHPNGKQYRLNKADVIDPNGEGAILYIMDVQS